MKTRFVLIESNSGYVWGEAVAENIVSACRMVDEGIGETDRAYEELRNDPRDSTGYYIVHDASKAPAFLGDNGQDRAYIEAVSALPIAGYVRSERKRY